MIPLIDDGYAQWYADRLWQLLPAIYRTLDVGPTPSAAGPLRELVNRIGNQAAMVRRNIDRLSENQSIETCDDWVIPYIGDLVATRLVSCLDAASQRIDVAKTIYYRRRAGTVGILEELAADIAVRDARVVEFFRRMARTRHQFDPPISYRIENPISGPTGLAENAPTTANLRGKWSASASYFLNDEATYYGQTYVALVANPNAAPDQNSADWQLVAAQPSLEVVEGLIGAYSGTPIGGFADLRNTYAASNNGTAFDEYSYTADLRTGGQTLGWYNIRHLGVFIWWLQAFLIAGAIPVSNGKTPPCFTFDPTGREIQLFAPSQRARTLSSEPNVWGENWVSPEEWELPVAIRETLWQTAPNELYPQAFSVGLAAGGTSAPVPLSSVTVHPASGIFSFVGGAEPIGTITTSYSFGLLSQIGAGGFSAGILTDLTQPTPAITISGGGPLDTALAEVATNPMVQINDSQTYPVPAATLTVTTGNTVWVGAESGQRPVVRATTGSPTQWDIMGNAAESGPPTVLVLQGMLLQGFDVVLQGSFDAVYLRMMTLDPGNAGSTTGSFATAIDGLPLKPTNLYIEGTVTQLVLERCITGPVRTRNGGAIEQLTATDSIIQCIPTHTVVTGAPAQPPTIFDPESLAASLKNQATPLSKQVLQDSPPLATELQSYQLNTVPSQTLITDLQSAVAQVSQSQAEAAWPLALADLALGFSDGTVSLSRCTVMGPTHTHRLSASECILDDVATAEDPQYGCVRFTAYANGSNLHQPYRCVQIAPESGLFQSRAFAQPEYVRLRSDADSRILTPTTGGSGCDTSAQAAAGSILSGAQNGSEMGVYCLEAVALKRRGLALKFEEYAPLGQLPVWIDVD